MILMDFFKKALAFAKDSVWKDDTKDEIILATAEKAFLKLKAGCTRGRRLIWLTGQSGTGKTSQLLAATQKFCSEHGLKPFHLAVRNFADLHPEAENLKNLPDFREKTNGFALKVLICTLKLAFDHGLDIVLEICFLDPCFEKFVIKSAQKNGYRISLQIMAVSRVVSQALVFKRACQTGRSTYQKSEDYFYSAMQKGIRVLSKNLNCTLWSACDCAPIYRGGVKGAVKVFKRQRSHPQPPLLDETKLLRAKCAILAEVYQDELF